MHGKTGFYGIMKDSSQMGCIQHVFWVSVDLNTRDLGTKKQGDNSQYDVDYFGFLGAKNDYWHSIN